MHILILSGISVVLLFDNDSKRKFGATSLSSGLFVGDRLFVALDIPPPRFDCCCFNALLAAYFSLAASAACFTSAIPTQSGNNMANNFAAAVCLASRFVPPTPNDRRT